MEAAAVGDTTEVKRLIGEAGADINFQSGNGYTPLMEAAHYRHLDTLQALIDFDAMWMLKITAVIQL